VRGPGLVGGALAGAGDGVASMSAAAVALCAGDGVGSLPSREISRFGDIACSGAGARAAGADTEEGDWNQCGHPPGTAEATGRAAAAFVTDVLTVPKSPVAAAAASPKIEVAAAAACPTCPKSAAATGLLPVPAPSDPLGTRAAAFDCPAPSLPRAENNVGCSSLDNPVWSTCVTTPV
jgi:hypothetical protein